MKERGWTLDVLTIVRRLVDRSSRRESAQTSRPPNEFTNEDIYTYAPELEKLHPDNRHIRDKIRQQLQVLRDAKLLIHLGPALWRLP